MLLSLVTVLRSSFFYVTSHFVDDVFRLEIDALFPKLFVKGGVSIDGTINIFKVIEKDTILNNCTLSA